MVSSGAKKKTPPNESKTDKTDPKVARKGVADALRSAYQETVNEEVPQDLLNLLGKLG